MRCPSLFLPCAVAASLVANGAEAAEVDPNVVPPAEARAPAPQTTDRAGWVHGGMQLLFGKYVLPGLNVGYQHRFANPGGDHAFIVGLKLVTYTSSRTLLDDGGTDFIRSTLLFGGGIDIGYRGNFVRNSPLKAGLLVLAEPHLAYGSYRLFLLTGVAGAFLRYKAFEMQITGGGGPALEDHCGSGSSCYSGERSGLVGTFNARAGFAF